MAIIGDGKVRKVEIFTAGDHSAGIARQVVTLTSSSPDGIFDANEFADPEMAIAAFKARLAEAMAEVWNEPVTVALEGEQIQD